MVDFLDKAQRVGRIVAGRHLISRHTSENSIRPPRTLTRFFQVVLHLMTCPDTCYGIVLRQNTSFTHSRKKINKRNQHEKHNGYHIGKKSLKLVHIRISLLIINCFRPTKIV